MEEGLNRNKLMHSVVEGTSSKRKLSDQSDEDPNNSPHKEDEDDPAILKKKLSDLTKEVSAKEDILRKLNLVKLYKTKEEYSHLPELSQKWLECCQQAIQDLYDILPEPKPSMSEFMSHLNIQPSMLEYNEEDETFNS